MQEQLPKDAKHAVGRRYWLNRLMGASLRSFTHPTEIYGFCRMGEGAQRRTHQSAECGEYVGGNY
jgi:hypothetical protein